MPDGLPHKCAVTESGRWEEVHIFLRLVDSSLCCLIDRFVSAGVTSEARLITMAKWPDHELTIFLRCEIRLDPFECKVVRDGMQKYLT